MSSCFLSLENVYRQYSHHVLYLLTLNHSVVMCREEAQHLANKLKKITVADIIESMEVTLLPFVLQGLETCRIYKLQMKLHIPEHLQNIVQDISEDWEEILEVMFVRALEDAIQSHVLLLSKISGIKKCH